LLKIKKNAKLLSINYKLQLLFKIKSIKKLYNVKRKESNLIYLRSPKHFNIGKQKILNINHKLFHPIKLIYSNMNINNLIGDTTKLFVSSEISIPQNVFLQTKSIKFFINTKFTIKWLGY
jgi:hypothetical protein